MKAEIRVSIRCASTRVRRELETVLAPDNANFPPGLRLAASSRGPVLRYRIGSGSAGTALSTAMALLRDASLFGQVWLLSRAPEGRPRPAK